MTDYPYIIYLMAVAYLNTCLLGYGNFVIYRLIISKRSIFENKNYCEVCRKQFHNIYSYPILGYILCGGKCVNCKNKIGGYHLLNELSVFIVTYGILTIKGLSLTGVTLSLVYMSLVLSLFLSFLIVGKKKHEKG